MMERFWLRWQQDSNGYCESYQREEKECRPWPEANGHHSFGQGIADFGGWFNFHEYYQIGK